ncbi:TonB-dependent receptor [Mitsuaria sp. GD03876]|uniref:TonB-dependent receptor domain-containing protein n=1 Tax=Mitsuaria sp. GD03876 TaxID=2975399 RepID=UPI00244D0524|nr:TonB-dependent receptor [Mitsuaria sp. GD03876]MDH0867728.1 TonB-dependent receptor [Mitsuaria sp. GD03876]
MQAFRPRATLRAVARAALLAAPAVSSLAFAQSAPLDPVIVIGTREAQPLSKSVADVVLIDADMLRNSGAGSVADVLRRYAGLQLTPNGGPGQTTGYLLRGSNTSSTVVMIDGVRVGSATLGQAAFESMSLANIERIEVLRGPASGLYGADALGGVIQVITKKGQGALDLRAGAAVGDYGSRQGDIAVSGAQAGFDYAASLSRETSDGMTAIRGDRRNDSYNPDRDGFGRTVASARLGFAPAEGHRVGVSATQSRLNAQYDGAFYDDNFVAHPEGDYRTRLKTRQVALDYRGVLSPIWTTTVQVAHGTDDSRTGLADAGRFKTTRDQATWQNALRIAPDQQVVLAYERLEEKADGVVADTLKRTNNAYIAGYSGSFGPAALEANLRRDDNSLYGNNTTGNIGASYALTSTLKVRALAGKTFRAPSFNETDFPFYGHHGIKPEDGRSAELGLVWRSGASSASATVYRNKVKNLIVFNPDPALCPASPDFAFGCAANVGRARMQGATLTGTHRLGNWNFAANVDFLDAKDTDSGQRLIRRAAHQESVSADYDTGAWSAGATVTDIGKRRDTGGNLGGYALVDLRATWRFLPQWRLEAKVLNAGDRDVEPTFGYQGLGRQAWVGVRYDMKGF